MNIQLGVLYSVCVTEIPRYPAATIGVARIYWGGALALSISQDSRVAMQPNVAVAN